MRDIHQEVTDKIISLIESGAGSLAPLWDAASGAPFNLTTGKPYTGINTLILALSGRTNPAWLTFKQCEAMGGRVRKGEKGTHVVFYKPIEDTSTKTEKAEAEGDTDETGRMRFILKTFVVFNADQCEDLPVAPTATIAKPFCGIEAAEVILTRAGAQIHEGGTRAFYSPAADAIHMPARDSFVSAGAFYAVALHELTHWTGHTSRLARDFSGRFGSEAYAFEELIAEIGAAFLCSDIGIAPVTLEGHAGYVDSWLRVLKNDKKAIFTAAAAASKAHQYIMAEVAAAIDTEAMAA